jgi:hypothetical protein
MHSSIIIFLIGLLGYEITCENEKDIPEELVKFAQILEIVKNNFKPILLHVSGIWTS